MEYLRKWMAEIYENINVQESLWLADYLNAISYGGFTQVEYLSKNKWMAEI